MDMVECNYTYICQSMCLPISLPLYMFFNWLYRIMTTFSLDQIFFFLQSKEIMIECNL